MATGAEEDLRGRRLHPQKDVSSTWESSPPSSFSFPASRRVPESKPQQQMTQSGIQSARGFSSRQSASTANPAGLSTTPLSTGNANIHRDDGEAGVYGTSTSIDARRRAIAPSSANIRQSSSSSSLSPVSLSSISTTSSDSSVASTSSHPRTYHPPQAPAPAHAEAPVYHPQPQRPYTTPSPALFQYENTNTGYVYPSSTSSAQAGQVDGYEEEYDYDYDYEYEEVEESDKLRRISEPGVAFQPQSYGNASAPYYAAPAYPPPFPNHIKPSSSSPVPIARSNINPNSNPSVRSNPQPPYGGGGGVGGAVVFQGEHNRSTYSWQGVGASGGAQSDMVPVVGTTSVPANSRRSFDQGNARMRAGMVPPQVHAPRASAGPYLF